jgi:PadR family transcriptional regulator, regulatory protein PadR
MNPERSRPSPIPNWSLRNRLDTGFVLLYYAEHMSLREHLGEFEQIALLAVLRLGQNSYGVPVRREIENRTGRTVTVGALYRTLDRLEKKGYVTSWFSDPVPERGGRSKRYFRVEPLGIRALNVSHRDLMAMWEGVDLRPSSKKASHAS